MNVDDDAPVLVGSLDLKPHYQDLLSLALDDKVRAPLFPPTHPRTLTRSCAAPLREWECCIHIPLGISVLCTTLLQHARTPPLSLHKRPLFTRPTAHAILQFEDFAKASADFWGALPEATRTGLSDGESSGALSSLASLSSHDVVPCRRLRWSHRLASPLRAFFDR